MPLERARASTGLILAPAAPLPPLAPGPKDYLNALLITLGCTLFLMTGSVKSKHAGADSSIFGMGLMLGYLGFDGFTSTFQDKLFKGYQMTIYNQILCEHTRPLRCAVGGVREAQRSAAQRASAAQAMCDQGCVAS